jgi:hypothetical protein
MLRFTIDFGPTKTRQTPLFNPQSPVSDPTLLARLGDTMVAKASADEVTRSVTTTSCAQSRAHSPKGVVRGKTELTQ